MEQIFCTEPAANADEARFVHLVIRGNVENLRDFLAERPDFPLERKCFSFDKPAIVQARNDKGLVDVLLDFGADIDARSGWDVGSYGALNETSEEMFQYLLQRGAKLDIHSACEHNKITKVREFLEHDPLLVNQRGPDGQMPLHYAATVELAQILLDAGADIDARCLDHISSAAQYCVDSRQELAKFLLESGADCDIFLAAALGDLERARALVESNPGCLSERLGEGSYDGHIFYWKLGSRRGPTQVAADRGHQDLVDFFRTKLPSQERFLFDCWAANEEAVLAEVKARPELVKNLPWERLRMVADAAWDGRTESVRVMLNAGFPVNTRGDHESTVLDRACVPGHVDTVRCILEYDPDFTLKNEFGGVPLTAALWGAENWAPADHVGAARLLLEAGAGGNPQDYKDGDRGLGVLLAWMARAGIESMVELLLEFGASPQACSREGESALALARKGGHESVVRLLENAP